MDTENLTTRDETLAASLYTAAAATTVPRIRVARFSYTIHGSKPLFDRVADAFPGLRRDLPPGHRALLERGEEQSPEDIALATRMQDVQCDALTG